MGSRTVVLFVVALFILPKCKAEPRGHNLPLGLHRMTEGHIDVLHEMPTPQVFWDEYCSIGKPVLLKGAALGMPSMSKWTDEYLVETLGDAMVKLESKNEKERKPEGSKGMGQDTVRNFIRTYRQENKYMVSQLPDQLREDVTVPQCVLCGSFRDRILESNIWMSSGDTNSLLHGDSDNALNCLLVGSKDWILIDPIYAKNIPIAIEAGMPYGGLALLNVNQVDLIQYPKFRSVRWYYANVTAGDCLFLPKGHFHQVRSYGSRNIAVTMLLARLDKFEPYDCPESGLPASEMLSDVPMVWTYDGYSKQTMGNPDPFSLNASILEMCEENDGFITSELMAAALLNLVDISEERYEGSFVVDKDFKPSEDNTQIMANRAREIVMLVHGRTARGLDCHNLRNMSVEVLKQISEIMDSDPANDENYEFKEITPDEVRLWLRSSMRLSKEAFLHLYRIDGSTSGAEWILDTMDEDMDGEITMDELRVNMEKVLARFRQSMIQEYVIDGEEIQHLHEESE